MPLTFSQGQERRLDMDIIPIIPPEEAAFSIRILSTSSPVPAGQYLTIHFQVTNLSDFRSGYDIMHYLDGVPSASRPFSMDAISPGQTVIDPGPWFRGGVTLGRSTPATKTYKICTISIPNGAHRNCDETVIRWT